MTNIDELIHHHADHLINGAPHDEALFDMIALGVDREILERAYNNHEYITNDDYMAVVESEIRDACRLTEDGDISADALTMMLISDSVCDIVDTFISICPDLEDEFNVAMLMSKRILRGVLNASALVQTNGNWHGSLVSDLFLSAHEFETADAPFPQSPIVPDEDEMLAEALKCDKDLDFSDIAARLYSEHPVKVMQDLTANGELSRDCGQEE